MKKETDKGVLRKLQTPISKEVLEHLRIMRERIVFADAPDRARIFLERGLLEPIEKELLRLQAEKTLSLLKQVQSDKTIKNNYSKLVEFERLYRERFLR